MHTLSFCLRGEKDALACLLFTNRIHIGGHVVLDVATVPLQKRNLFWWDICTLGDEQ